VAGQKSLPVQNFYLPAINPAARFLGTGIWSGR